jgi:hypothetical protein
MTHNPPATLWPSPTGPDCPSCAHDTTDWSGTARSLDDPDTIVHLWQCPACRAEWTIRVTCWPVLDGPDCPVCEIPETRWTGIDPDHHGDTWTCPAGHEFVLTPEGFIYVPGGEA